jgi:predicted ATP-grasp superfamily ATP-dependent carboligase
MRILLTGARAPVALELTRALGSAGHMVLAADSLPITLAGASRFAAGRVRLPPPRYQPAAFVAAVIAAIEQFGVELILPTCEELFYLAAAHRELSTRCRLFCPRLPLLAALHDKGAFQRRAAALGLRTPRTAVVRSRDELQAALPDFPRYLLKPAFSRFAARVITNCGPFAGRRRLDDCRPTLDDPWLVQEFVAGEAICSYSLLHNGRVTAHCAYSTPFTAGQGSGTAFVSIDPHPTYAIAQTLGADGFTGQLALDFLRTAAGELILLECNPRAVSGAHLIRPDKLLGAILDPAQPTWLEPAGTRRQLALAVLPVAVARAITRPWRRAAWHSLGAAAQTPDVLLHPDDPLPALAQLPQVALLLARAAARGIGPLAATTDDIEWNGDADLLARGA